MSKDNKNKKAKIIRIEQKSITALTKMAADENMKTGPFIEAKLEKMAKESKYYEQ